MTKPTRHHTPVRVEPGAHDDEPSTPVYQPAPDMDAYMIDGLLFVATHGPGGVAVLDQEARANLIELLLALDMPAALTPLESVG